MAAVPRRPLRRLRLPLRRGRRRRARAVLVPAARLARARRARVAGRHPAALPGCRFDREPVALDRARTRTWCARCARYVDGRRRAARRRASGIWFTGDVGTGKTTLAMLISQGRDGGRPHGRDLLAAAPARRCCARRSTTTSRVLASRAARPAVPPSTCCTSTTSAPSRRSPWVLEQLYTIVNTRYEDGRALVLTTNLEPATSCRSRSASARSRGSSRCAATRC